MEANIFLILDDEVEELERLLRLDKYRQYGKSRRVLLESEVIREPRSKRINCKFFYRQEIKEQEIISWFQDWKDFFGIDEEVYKKYSLNYGCIVVNIERSTYLITYGHAHQWAKSIADINFGLDIAERILEKDQILMVSSQFLKGTKSRTYTQFKGGGYLMPDVGEANNQVIGGVTTTIPNSKLYQYKKHLKFTTSVKIVDSDLTPKDMITLVGELHYIRKILQ
ncbi:DUF6119 family protein [Bhargavaea beijingensis]|uniref:Uncharacterized protein n=1 Tax=Bhargavaea beijingensis TaxID=426756 RepID=A0ABX9ZDM1_9BACL|nr:DUF6119 family protein [Bhargavaea beijingensis]RSK33714.1 hypothetical protein EJA12_06100 [Bhargavaea beijingensis]